MEIKLDGKKHFLLQSDPGTVGAALIEINEYLEANGRALQSISVDGRDAPAEEITPAFGQVPVSDVTLLEIVSADVRALVIESIAELAEVVPELPSPARNSPRSSRAIRRNRPLVDSTSSCTSGACSKSVKAKSRTL